MITVVEPTFEILTDIDGIEQHIERCGRVCYKSEDRITDSSAGKFVRNICRRRHESVLEHASITAIVICSRSCSHQLVRHRIAAYSQESQRYCDYGKRGLQVICPPRIGLLPGTYMAECYEDGWRIWRYGKIWEPTTEKQRQWAVLIDSAYSEYLAERSEGIPPEDARYVLPNATKTELAVTFNLRQWRHVFEERALNKHAQWEIRSIFEGLLDEFRLMMPDVFGDLGNE